MPDISCVTGLRNRPFRHTRKFFESLVGQTIPVEIVVVDYGSDARHLAWERRMFSGKPNVNLVEVTQGVEIWNEARALNIGIRAATSEYIFAVNADLVFCENYADSILDVLKNKPKTLVTSRRIELDERGRPMRQFMPEYYYGTCIGGHKSMFHDIHGFDEVFISSYLDTDFVGRARDCGYSVVNISDRTACYHQYHRHITMNVGNEQEWNKAYSAGQEHSRNPNKPRIRNGNAWGEM
jgi:GT2 family glycosyltransferase